MWCAASWVGSDWPLFGNDISYCYCHCLTDANFSVVLQMVDGRNSTMEKLSCNIYFTPERGGVVAQLYSMLFCHENRVNQYRNYTVFKLHKKKANLCSASWLLFCSATMGLTEGTPLMSISTMTIRIYSPLRCPSPWGNMTLSSYNSYSANTYLSFLLKEPVHL